MKKKELDQFKKILDDEKSKILRHLEKLSESQEISDVNVNSGDSADIAAVEINQTNLQKIGKREAYLLKKIDLALKKIGEGTYGECESCGESIAPARLMARPVAQLCIDCKTEQESMERRYSSKIDADEEDSVFEEAEEG